MRRILGGTASVIGVAAIAGLLLFGSQAMRAAHLTTADVIESPSPSPTPITEICITADQCAPATPACVPGEGVTCDSGPAPLPSPTPDQASGRPGTHGPAGQIQASAVTQIAGNRIRVVVAVLYEADWVNGAAVSVTCSGPGLSFHDSGLTRARSSWPADAVNSGYPSALFFAETTGEIDQAAAAAHKYACHGSASYQGMTATF